MPSRGRDEGPPHHSLGPDVVSGDKWCHSSLDPSLLQDSFEGQDVGRNLTGSNDHCLPLRFDLAGSSGRSNGRWAAAPEVIGTHQQWWGLSGEPTYRVASSGDGGGGFTPREKGSHSGSEGGDETSKPRGQRRRLVESRLLERRQRVLAEKGSQREGWKERRQRRRPERRRKRRRSEEGRQEEVRDASLGAPGWELENLDGSSWTPSPGELLDCDLKNDAEEKIDAINYSMTRLGML